MNKLHKDLLALIKKEASKSPTVSKHKANYEGHNDKSYNLSNPKLRKITESWLKKQSNFSFGEFIKLLNSLYKRSDSSTEKYIAGFIIEYSPQYRGQIDPELLDKWLDNLVGWAQVDSLCQSKFTLGDMLSNWSRWRRLLRKLNKSKNINKRRASLVLLIKPVRDLEEKRFLELAIENMESVKHEKDILITKAISWLLREMIKNYRAQVESYLTENQDNLPNVAVREVKRKLETGRK